MKKVLIAYGMFLGFTLATAWIVRPLVRGLQIPYLKDVL